MSLSSCNRTKCPIIELDWFRLRRRSVERINRPKTCKQNTKMAGNVLTIVEPRKSSSEGNSSEDEFGKFEQSDRESADLSLEIVREQRRRRKTIVSSFRLAELVPTSNTPFTNYRRKSTSVLNAELVVDYKANEQ